MARYSIYGLVVQSDVALPGVAPQPTDPSAAVDVFLTLAGTAPIPDEWECLPWCLGRELEGDDWYLRGWTAATPSGVALRVRVGLGTDETTALFSPGGTRMQVYWRRPTKDSRTHLADLASWILDSALGFCARQRGWPVLHGSAIAVNGRVIALLGDKGAGKSTLAAAFLAEGGSLVADDHVVLKREGEAFAAQPGPPYLRLWPASLPVLGGCVEDPPRVYSDLEKRRVQADGNDSGRAGPGPGAPARLSAVYVLLPRSASCPAPVIERLPPTSALHQVLLMRWSRMQISVEHTAGELEALTGMVRTVPVRRVLRPDRMDSLPDVVREIRTDLSRHGDQ